MSIKRRKTIYFLLITILASIMLTACGEDKNTGTEPTTLETTTMETVETTTKTEPTTAEIEPTVMETEEPIPTYGLLQMQSLEGLALEENPKTPYEMKLYSKATEAIENSLKITIKEAERKMISFSFISESEIMNGITKGIILEKNEDVTYTGNNLSYIGDIATFSIVLPDSVESSTVVYEISFKNEEENYYSGFFAISFQ